MKGDEIEEAEIGGTFEWLELRRRGWGPLSSGVVVRDCDWDWAEYERG